MQDANSGKIKINYAKELFKICLSERMASEDWASHMVALAHNFTLQTFPEFLTGLEGSGWVTSRTHLGSQEWRATWNLRGLEAKKIL